MVGIPITTDFAMTMQASSLLKLLQLSSVSLPVGGYAFSQGLEYAIDTGWVTNFEHVNDWVTDQLMLSFSKVDLPILWQAMPAAQTGMLTQNWQSFITLNDLILACRETKELRLTDTAMGEALARILRHHEIATPFEATDDISFVSLFALACAHWKIDPEASMIGFTWAWLENQVAAATKLVPLGQTQAQQLLSSIQQHVPSAIEAAKHIHQDDIGAGLPALAIASAYHETQYSRLFRS